MFKEKVLRCRAALYFAMADKSWSYRQWRDLFLLQSGEDRRWLADNELANIAMEFGAYSTQYNLAFTGREWYYEYLSLLGGAEAEWVKGAC